MREFVIYRGKSVAAVLKQEKNDYLADKDAVGWFLQQIKPIALLKNKEFEVAKAAYEGDRAARMLLIKSNLRFVVKLARQHYAKHPFVPMEDLIAYGTLGLIRGIEKFEPKKGYRLSTYVFWWIKQEITRGCHGTGDLIRKPSHLHAHYAWVSRIQDEFTRDYRKPPTYDELATHLNRLEIQAATTKGKTKPKQKWTPKKVQRLLSTFSGLVSLDSTVDGGTDKDYDTENISNRLILPSEELSPEEQVDRLMLREQLAKAMTTLDPEEQQVLYLAYLDGDATVNYRKIASDMKLQANQVRHIKDRALGKLRTNFPQLSQFLGAA